MRAKESIINEINILLKGYGFMNFNLACAEDEKSYCIQREGNQLAVDGPVSSLDGNILLIVSVLVKDLMKETMEEKTNTKQVIILAH